jgi:hypothetical protein
MVSGQLDTIGMVSPSHYNSFKLFASTWKRQLVEQSSLRRRLVGRFALESSPQRGFDV